MLLKFAYDGTKFYGYQRQPDKPTVEGEIISVLRDSGLDATIKSASRTDRGVSALGNVIYLADDEPERVMGVLNSRLHHIFFYGYSLENCNPRHARERWYRYHIPDFGYSLEDLREAASLFEGAHDFRHFTRARNNTELEIRKIVVNFSNGYFIVDFYAQYYLWNLIRRIVAAMVAYASGKKFSYEVFEEKNSFGLAPPEPLILMDVRYDFSFKIRPFKRREREKLFRRYSAGMVYHYLSQL